MKLTVLVATVIPLLPLWQLIWGLRFIPAFSSACSEENGMTLSYIIKSAIYEDSPTTH